MSKWPTIEGKRLTQQDVHMFVVDRDRARRDLRQEKSRVAELQELVEEWQAGAEHTAKNLQIVGEEGDRTELLLIEQQERVAELEARLKPRSMPARYEPRTQGQKLGYLVEECGEVLAAAGKTIRWGMTSANPELPQSKREMNATWLSRELLDLRRAIAFVEQELDKYKYVPDREETEAESENQPGRDEEDVSCCSLDVPHSHSPSGHVRLNYDRIEAEQSERED